MNNVYQKLKNCYAAVCERTDFVPKVAIILGSGLGGLAEVVDTVCTIDYSDLPDFPVSTVSGHAGRFLFGYIGKTPVVLMQGRVHFYEGYPMEDVIMPTRLMGMLGAEILFLTNAAGGINQSFSVGSLMLITDHISCFIPSVLKGENIEELGTRFPDVTHVYDEELCDIIRKNAKAQQLDLKEGVYLQTQGPNFETPAEIRAFRALGADAVGMSTACEAQAAVHMGMRVCGISCISNMAAGLNHEPLSHLDVKAAADRVADRFQKLVYDCVSEF